MLHQLRSALFLAGFLTVCSGVAHAQVDTTLYYQLDYMKATSPDYVDVEVDIWKPIHEARIAAGELQSWTLYWVRFGERTEYDYITVNVYRGLSSVGSETTNFQELAQRVHPNKDVAAEMTRTANARQMVKSELWSGIDIAAGSDMHGSDISVGYMRVAPGQEAGYLSLERDVWKPMHEERIRRGALKGWGVYQLVMPGGTDYPYSYAAVNVWGGWGPGPTNMEIASKVHPGVAWAEITRKTNTAREMPSFEVWQVLEHVHAEPPR